MCHHFGLTRPIQINQMGKIPEDLFLRKMNEWREEQSKILSQMRAHQTANHNYLEDRIRYTLGNPPTEKLGC